MEITKQKTIHFTAAIIKKVLYLKAYKREITLSKELFKSG